MVDHEDFQLHGHAGTLHAQRWQGEDPAAYVALLCHGYGEHIGRYQYVADRLVADGAAVHGMDHVGHGRSAGERVLVADYEKVVEDFRLLEEHARGQHPGLPVVLIGHSMGGMIAARYAQRYGQELVAVVLSGPVIGRWQAAEDLLAAEEIPDAPIDPATLSRDEAIGTAYVEDPLVWHGPFKRPTLAALQDCLETIGETGRIVDTPVLWLHGEEDQLVPYAGSHLGWQRIAGPESEARSYPGARHEIFNETNKDEVLDDVIGFVRRYV